MNGYIKHSKLGLIPNDWKGSKLSEIVDLIHGYQFRSEDFTSDGIAVIKIGNVMGNDLKLDNLSFIDYSRLENFKQYKIEKGDILMSLTGNIGRVIEVGTLESEYLQNYRVGKFIPVDSNELIKRYVKYLLSSPLVLSQFFKFSNQSAQANFGKQDMDKVWVTIPTSLPEQQKIAEILSTVDAKIEVIDQQITETQTLKKGLMQRLLTKGIGHTEFKDSPLGEIPKSWEVVRIGDLGNVVTGSTPKTSVNEFYAEEGVLWASPADLTNIKYVNNTKKKLTPIGFEQTRKLPPNSILVTCIGSTIGKIGMTNSWMSTNQQINSIVCSDLNDSEFYYYVIEKNAELIKSMAGTQAVPLLNKTDFSNVLVIKPNLIEQRKISQILSSIDDKLEVLSEKKTHYQELKQGLMQQLLTGKIRIKI
jgi:type I restriction enzyme S subunit